ncbi:MAG: hypothetical protein PT116_24115 [Aphanizomenon gracile PMC638.10]|nr:hypothetical protein [Aphanizomenon gracile PMC638.10]
MIAKNSVGIAFFGMWGCDSEALRRNRLLGDDGNAIAFWMMGSAIAKRCCKQFAVLGVWEGDRLLK